MATLGFIARWLHIAASLGLVGGACILLLAGASDHSIATAWRRRVVFTSCALALLALVTGLGVLATQTALLEARAAAAFDLQALARVAISTQGGRVWLVRHALLLILTGFLFLCLHGKQRFDWSAPHGGMAGVALLALAGLAAAGHAAAVEPDTLRAIIVDGVHLVAAGIWVGALPALALLLGMTSRSDGADAMPYAVIAARRFSQAALTAVIVLVVSGVATAVLYVPNIAALVGTAYGKVLLAKVGLFASLLVVAAFNRRLVRLLACGAAVESRAAMRRLARFVTVEAALALALAGVVATLNVTPPARHEQPIWPLSVRLSLSVLDTVPELRSQVFMSGQLAVVGVVLVLSALLVRKIRIPLLGGALVLLATAAYFGAVPLAIDAYPTTYYRPTVRYHASSIAAGAALYQENCAVCHGRNGGGDGPAAAGLPRRPADLRAAHAAHHTAGDIFWWVSHGIPRGGMPAFADRLGEDQRWDVINYVRFLAAVDAAGLLGPIVDPSQASLVAPDFTYTLAPGSYRALRDFRRQRHVLLVLYTMPNSESRIAQLADLYPTLATLGAEVVAVPRDAVPDPIKFGSPGAVLPVVLDGSADIVSVYGGFTAAPHAEFLIDRQGYIRARWATRGATTRDVNLLLADIRALNEERTVASLPDEHVH